MGKKNPKNAVPGMDEALKAGGTIIITQTEPAGKLETKRISSFFQFRRKVKETLILTGMRFCREATIRQRESAIHSFPIPQTGLFQ